MATVLSARLVALPEYAASPPTRLTFLYSALAPRKTANPTGFHSALSWWKATLTTLLAAGMFGEDSLVLSANDDLRERLRWDKIGRPSSLGTVIDELAAAGDLVPLERYLARGIQSSSWLAVLATPLVWSFSRLKASIAGEEDAGEGGEEKLWRSRQGEWVVRELVERAAQGLLPRLPDLHADPIARLYTVKTFQKLIGSLCLPETTLSTRDCAVLAAYLHSDLKLCLFDGEVIKFTSPFSTTPLSTISITTSDQGILSLLTTLTTLTAQIRSIELQISEQQSQMVVYNAKKQMSLVKSHLQRRKQLESLLEKRLASRDQLGGVLHSIEKAVGDEETMKALELGTSTLRTLISSPLLSLDHIDETTLALSDALADAEEINTAVSAPGVGLLAAQDDEIEAELREMVESAEREEREEAEQVAEQKELREYEERAAAAITIERERQTLEDHRVALLEARVRDLATPAATGAPTTAEAEGDTEVRSERVIAE